MKKTALAIGMTASICLAGTATAGALAHPSAKSGFRATVSPSKPSVGTTVTAKATGAAKSQTYYCIDSIYKKGAPLDANSGYVPSLKTLKSSASGKITCTQVFLSFKAKDSAGKQHSCPPTKADKKAGWGCGVSFASAKHHNQHTTGVFKF